ncbi:MAG TPA: hypothetical protein VLE72_03215 [Candidatus Saccharimonadales bacterium]|nr:hypothetical protein [Candidatus Saccharimonadales bacterium]
MELPGALHLSIISLDVYFCPWQGYYNSISKGIMMDLSPFGELFRKSWELYQKKFKTLAMLLALPFIANVLSIIGQHGHKSSFAGFSTSMFVAAGAAALIIGLIFVAISLWIQVAVIYAVDGSEDQPDVSKLLVRSWPMVLPMLLVAILAGLAVLGGLILLIVPGIIFGVWFAFSSYTLVLENQRGTEALKASKALVSGRWGTVFGRLVLLFLVLIGISIVTSIVLVFLPATLRSIASAAVSNFVISPLGVVFTYLFYKELKGSSAGLAQAEVSV